MSYQLLVRCCFLFLFVLLSAFAIQISGKLGYPSSALSDFLISGVAVLIAAGVTAGVYRISGINKRNQKSKQK